MTRLIKAYAVGSMLLAVLILFAIWPTALFYGGAIATHSDKPEVIRDGALMALTPMIIAPLILLAAPLVYCFPRLQMPAAIAMTGLFAAPFYFLGSDKTLDWLAMVFR